MTVIEKYNDLDGTTQSRTAIEKLITEAKKAEQKHVVNKLNSILEAYPDKTRFKIYLSEKQAEIIPIGLLAALDYTEDREETPGLSKAVSPNDIYEMITNKMISLIEKSTGKNYKTKWQRKGYAIAFNFESKKPYRGINNLMLSSFGSDLLENPFYLTFKQIEKLGGKLKKGSKGEEVIYYNFFYRFEQAEPKLNFKTHDKKKFINWVKTNKSKISVLNGNKALTLADLVYQSQYAYIRYYNVFNGKDIEGIDFDLENFKIGYVDNQIKGNTDKSIELAEAIVKSYPKPKIKIKPNAKTQRAFYNYKDDYIELPTMSKFETAIDYYRTLFHEITHSTGAKKRLNRPIQNRFGSKAYAKEELIAEFGSIFLSAFAGIMWRNNNNHAEYLKGWKNQIKHLKEDNKLLIQAASAAQKAADYVLNNDAKGVPSFIKKILSKPEQLKMALNAPRHKGLAKTALTECGRLKPGYKYEKGGKIKKVTPKKTTKPKSKEKESKPKATKEKSSPIGYMLVDNITGDTIATKKTLIDLKKVFLDIVKDDFKDTEPLVYEIIKKGTKNVPGKKIKVDWVKKKRPNKQLEMALAAPKSLNISTDDFKKMTVSELRKYTLKYYLDNLKGNKTAIKNHLKEIIFTGTAGKKIAKGGAMYSEKAAVIEHLEELVKNSTYNNWGNRKKNDPKNVLGYLNFKSKIEIDGKKRHVRIAIILTKDRKTNLKNVDVGNKKSGKISSGRNAIPAIGETLPQHENTKKYQTQKENDNKKALNSPISTNNKVKSINDIGQQESEFYTVNGEVGKFLQAVERKPYHSVVITLDGPQGAGKTTTLYNFMNAFAIAGNKSIFLSLEEHPESALAIEKRDKYLPDDAARRNISILGEVASKEELYEFIKDFDIIFLDSWQKLLRAIGNIHLDEDLRKKFHGKVFVVIFQQTTTGRTKGGAEVVFDGDIIIKMQKEASFTDNYAYFDKHRYTKIPVENIQYNIAGAYTYNPNQKQDVSDVTFDEITETQKLIATPI